MAVIQQRQGLLQAVTSCLTLALMVVKPLLALAQLLAENVFPAGKLRHLLVEGCDIHTVLEPQVWSVLLLLLCRVLCRAAGSDRPDASVAPVRSGVKILKQRFPIKAELPRLWKGEARGRREKTAPVRTKK